jgi:hypothetical protein
MAEAAASGSKMRDNAGPLLLLHSGVIYPDERDPRKFFEAVARLKAQGLLTPARLRIVLRATGHDDYLRGLIESAGIQSLVSLAPLIPYEAALSEMLGADGLLILQAANCNDQIPAKLYEYLRAHRPILGLTDPSGDTAKALKVAGIDTIAPLDSVEAIAAAIVRFVSLLEDKSAPVATVEAVASASREARTLALAALMERAVQLHHAVLK